MVYISAVIITLNEEANINRCLKSLQGVADEIVVLDSLSTDNTREICKSYNVKFIEQPFLGYIEQKNKALDYASNNYILSLDADEALSDKLKQAILQIKDNWIADGYVFNRLTNYCGRWIYHTDWYPDKKLRLFDRRKGSWKGINPHDEFRLIPGSKKHYIKGDILHYSFPSVDHHLEVLKKFTTIMATENFQRGKKVNILSIVIKPVWKFLKSYIIRLGFMDGYYGYVIAKISAHATFVKYLKLRELYKN